MGAEMALREIGSPTLDELLDYVILLAHLRPEKLAARRCVGMGGSRLKRRFCPWRSRRSRWRLWGVSVPATLTRRICCVDSSVARSPYPRLARISVSIQGFTRVPVFS